MRFVVGLALLALNVPLGRLALADDAKPPEAKPEAKDATKPELRSKVPLRVVRILSDGQQALLFDRNKGSHVLAEVGNTIEGYSVVEIDDDEVTLAIDGTQIVLAAPDLSWRRRDREDDVRPARAAKKPEIKAPGPMDPYATLGPIDPYATPHSSDGPVDPYAAEPQQATRAPVDPYAADAPHATRAPVDPYAEVPVRVVEAPVVNVVEAPTPTPPAVKQPVVPPTTLPAVAPAPPVVTPPVAPAGALVLKQKDVQVALADFSKLASAIRGTFTPAGVRLDGIAPGSLFAKAGLRTGDVIVTVDGQAVRSIEDAADLYVRAPTARNVTVQVTRAGKPLTLHVSIQ